MAATEPQGTSNSPPPGLLLGFYAFLGTLLSFAFGREPGAVPDDVVGELFLTVMAICSFVPLYSVFDVMSVGVIKDKHGINDKKPSDLLNTALPEHVVLAVRAQANQVEQLPGFVISALCFSYFVNGRMGGILACLWVVLRTIYSQKYRRSAGKSFNDKGLKQYTIPCYFVLNGMASATVVHMIRYAVGSVRG